MTNDSTGSTGHSEAWGRCKRIAQQFMGSDHDTNNSNIHTNDDKTKWNGWGFEDTRIELNATQQVCITGNRYNSMFPSERVLPQLRTWAEKNIGIDIHRMSRANVDFPSINSASVVSCVEFIQQLEKQHQIPFTTDVEERIRHSHGHTCKEIYHLRHKTTLSRIPDIVIWPGSHEQVELIVELAQKHDDVCIIPYGGGTNVSGALQCPKNETRMVVSLDMRRMNRIKTIDKENMTVCCESGIIGVDFHQELELQGMTLGHEPDSWEFSTLGGWVSTRASGMKKNIYGNIEDMVLNVKMVTPRGTINKSCSVPRVSMGPDFTQVILGSEGILGVITEVTLRIRPRPSVQLYDSLLFPTFEQGVAAMREIGQSRCAPASIRLMDNIQFQLGQALKPQTATPLRSAALDVVKRAYVVNYKGFQPETMCAATLLFEGSSDTVEWQKERVLAIAKRHGAMHTGEENGFRGYFLTYIIAYLRDFAFDYYFLSESFETTVAWTNVVSLCRKLDKRIMDTAIKHGVKKQPLVCFRVTQVYETGACIYVYFGINYDGVNNPLEVFDQVEKVAVNTLLEMGASLSHHHGIGKHRQAWLARAISQPALTGIKAVKEAVDPKNLFCSGNII